MAKDKKKNPSVPKKDEYTRITYLYQAANLIIKSPHLQTLSRGYSKNATVIAKKSVLKLTPNFKRTMCKKCNILLIPGKTLSVRMENMSRDKLPHNDILVHQCVCGTKKRYPVGRNRDYQLFSERLDVRI